MCRESPKVATSSGPFGTVFGVQFSAVFQSLLIGLVLQVALSSILLVGAGLLTHSLIDLERQDLGFNIENLLLIRTDARLAGYRQEGLLPLYRQLHDRLRRIERHRHAGARRREPQRSVGMAFDREVEISARRRADDRWRGASGASLHPATNAERRTAARNAVENRDCIVMLLLCTRNARR